jgi:Holliday junction resolvasome RuvABC endonuclease subunit
MIREFAEQMIRDGVVGCARAEKRELLHSLTVTVFTSV